MRPGCYPFCRSCRRQARGMAAAGHPNPCSAQRWIGPTLHKPAIDAAGCREFEATDQAGEERAAPPLGPSQAVHHQQFPTPAPCHRATVLPSLSAPAAPAPGER